MDGPPLPLVLRHSKQGRATAPAGAEALEAWTGHVLWFARSSAYLETSATVPDCARAQESAGHPLQPVASGWTLAASR